MYETEVFYDSISFKIKAHGKISTVFIIYFIDFFIDCVMLNIFFLILHVDFKKRCNFAEVYYIPIILSTLVVNNIIQMSI